MEEFNSSLGPSPSQKPEPSIKLKGKRLRAKLPRRGQAGAEETKGEEKYYQAPNPGTYRNIPPPSEQVFSEKAPSFSLKAPAEESKTPRTAAAFAEARKRTGLSSPASTVVEGYDPNLSSVSTRTVPSYKPERKSTGEDLTPYLKSYPALLTGLSLATEGAKARRRELLETILPTNDMYKTKNGEDVTISDMVEVKGPLSELKTKTTDPRKTQNYWNIEINDIKEKFDNYKISSGKGIRRMSGRGVSFNIKEEPETKPKSIKLKIAGVIEKEPSYVPFGRYAINRFKLANDIFMLRTQKGGAIPRLLTQKLSSKLSKIIKTIADKGTPSFEEIGNLDTLDKQILHKILQESHISSISTPNPSRDQDEKDHRRFLILKGELISGNNNQNLIKELKTLIIRLLSKEILPRREAMNALTELALIETI
jgi:hypothetical protein